QMVVVAKLGHPLKVTRRLVVILPPLIYRHPGFGEAARTVKTLGSQLGADIVGLVVNDEVERFAELMNPIRPATPIRFERVERWGTLLSDLRRQTQQDDLVIVLSARRGTLPWHPKLERLPGQLAGLVPESFLVFYPAELDSRRREIPSPRVLPRGL